MWLPFLRDKADLESPDGNEAVRSVEVLIHSSGRLEFQYVGLLVQRPEPGESRVQVLHERCGASLKAIVQR